MSTAIQCNEAINYWQICGDFCFICLCLTLIGSHYISISNWGSSVVPPDPKQQIFQNCLKTWTNILPVVSTAFDGFAFASELVVTGEALILGFGLFSLPANGEVTPGIAGRFIGGDLATGLFLKCIKNDRSYTIRVPIKG